MRKRSTIYSCNYQTRTNGEIPQWNDWKTVVPQKSASRMTDIRRLREPSGIDGWNNKPFGETIRASITSARPFGLSSILFELIPDNKRRSSNRYRQRHLADNEPELESQLERRAIYVYLSLCFSCDRLKLFVNALAFSRIVRQRIADQHVNRAPREFHRRIPSFKSIPRIRFLFKSRDVPRIRELTTRP